MYMWIYKYTHIYGYAYTHICTAVMCELRENTIHVCIICIYVIEVCTYVLYMRVRMYRI